MTALPTVTDLTIEEKIGQMLCLGWMAPHCLLNINEQARACVQDVKAGGMIVMGRNISTGVRPLPPINAEAMRSVLAEMQGLATIPLLLATDQEGGSVARFATAPFTRMPPALTIGNTSDPQLAREAAYATANELAAIGINWNFAPVADVNSNPKNPVIGDRSFGATVEAVAPMVAAQVKGYQEGGVLACTKHFPGHGDTAEDSHFDLPTLPFTLKEMMERELVPFRAAIDADIASIMTAHILFPSLDPELPATLSYPILTGLLREKLGFTGLIVTDCLEMNGVAGHWGTARAAVLAAKAGADMLLICHTWANQKAAYDALLAAVASGELSLERVDDAVSRVLAAKGQMLTLPRPELSAIGSPEHIAVRDRITTRPVEDSFSTLGAEAPTPLPSR